MLVEDEKGVRGLAVYVLRKLGYTVFEARSAEEAKEIVLQTPEMQIDLLLADVVLPHSSGKSLADWMQHRQPGIRILFASGYIEETVFSNYKIAPNTPFLQKPFMPPRLAKKVREALDGATA